MEIIKRTTTEVEKETVSTTGYGEKLQVSYSSYGHLVLRFFSLNIPDSLCITCDVPVYYDTLNKEWNHHNSLNAVCGKAVPKSSVPKETLIVMDQNESASLIRFVQEHVKV